jgi:heme a synthase
MRGAEATRFPGINETASMSTSAIHSAVPALAPTLRIGSPLLHGLSLLAFLLVLPVITLGAEVTTKGVGMADDVSLRAPFHFVKVWLSGELTARGFGFTIEHAHRQAAWLLGMVSIAIAVVACVTRTPGWLKALTLVTLAVVSLQGILGIFRVQLNAVLGSSLALVHGAFATVAVGLLLTQAVVTSRSWSLTVPNERKLIVLRRWAIATTGAAVLQTVVGGLIRHRDLELGARLHLIGAFIVFAFVFVTIKFAREADMPAFQRLSRILMALLTIQVLMGVEAFLFWMRRHYFPETVGLESTAVQLTRSAHYVVGNLICATLFAVSAKALWAPRARLSEAAA